MHALPFALLGLGVAAWLVLLGRGDERRSIARLLVEAVAAHWVIAVIISVGLVACGCFRPPIAMAGALAVPAMALVVRGGASSSSPARRRWATTLEAAAIALGLLLAPLTRPALVAPGMVGDAGVYWVMAVHHLLEGRLEGSVPFRPRLHGELLDVFNRDNTIAVSTAAIDRDVGSYLPGTYVTPGDRDRFTFQFLPGWPMAMALWAGTFGLPGLFGVQPFLYVLSIALFALVTQRHARGVAVPLAVAALFAGSPLLLYFSRYSTSELFLLFCFLFILHFARERPPGGPALGAAGVLLVGLTHSSVFLYAALLLAAAVEAARRSDRRLAWLTASSFAALLVALPSTFAMSPYYMRFVYAYAFAFLPLHEPGRAGLVAVTAFYLVGLGVSLFALRHAPRPGGPGAGPRGALPAATFLALCLVGLATALGAHRLGWTDRLASSATNVGAWALRPGYVDAGWASLVHLNVVSLILATSIVGLPLILALVVRDGRRLVAARFRSLLLLGVMLTLVIYTFVRIDTPFNYYCSRYYLPILVPSAWLLLASLPRRLRPGYRFGVLAIALGLAFNARYDLGLLRARSRNGPLEFALAVARRLPPGKVLFLRDDPLAVPILTLPLASLGHNPVVNVARMKGVQARDAALRYCRALGLDQAFWLRYEPAGGESVADPITLVVLDPGRPALYPLGFVARERRYSLTGSACEGAGGGGES
jgi:hypothetical protein